MIRKLMIAMPTGRGLVESETMVSIFSLAAALRRHAIDVELQTISFSEICVARNLLADKFMASSCDTLLFVDDDMTFAAQTIGDMIAIDQPFVGAYAPRRTMDLGLFGESFENAKGLARDQRLEVAKSSSASFVGTIDYSFEGEVYEGFAPALFAGAGILLLKRSVFEQLQNSDDSLSYSKYAHYDHGIANYFRRVETGSGIMAEDFSFCALWRSKCGGTIWLHTKGNIGHIGKQTFDASPMLSGELGKFNISSGDRPRLRMAKS